jgi:hypothetical protein
VHRKAAALLHALALFFTLSVPDLAYDMQKKACRGISIEIHGSVIAVGAREALLRPRPDRDSLSA